MPAPSINEALGLAARLYRPTKFRMEIPRLPLLVAQPNAGNLTYGTRAAATSIDTTLQFSTETVYFPGRNISSEPQKIAGPVDEIPYESTYSGDLDVAMRVSGNFTERTLFENWMNVVVHPVTQEFQYPDEYRCEIIITALTNEEKPIYSVVLTDAWPKTVGRVTVGQGQTDSVALMQVGLAFRKYVVELPNEVNAVPKPFMDRLRSTGPRNAEEASFDVNPVKAGRSSGLNANTGL